MWIKQLITVLCILYAGDSVAKTSSSNNIGYDYTTHSRRHSIIRGKTVTTTHRPLLQQYWHNFVRNLPTLPPVGWNITSPIGNLFNAGAHQIVESPVTAHYMIDETDRRKTKSTIRKSSRISQNPKRTQSRNYFSSYENMHHQMQLQPLGMDHNKVMHFYEPSTRQYYALQIESQPYYYNSLYYNGQYSYQNKHNNAYNRFDDENDSGPYDDELGYPEESHTYDSEESYELEPESESVHSHYDNEYDESRPEHDDGVELADNWGYTDEEVFADRNLKSGPDYLQTIPGSVIQIRKHLLKPEAEEHVKNTLLTIGNKLNTEKETNDTRKNKEK